MAKKQQRRPRRSFTAEFKADAVRLCKSGDRTVGQVAKDLDLTETALREWLRQMLQPPRGVGPRKTSSVSMMATYGFATLAMCGATSSCTAAPHPPPATAPMPASIHPTVTTREPVAPGGSGDVTLEGFTAARPRNAVGDLVVFQVELLSQPGAAFMAAFRVDAGGRTHWNGVLSRADALEVHPAGSSFIAIGPSAAFHAFAGAPAVPLGRVLAARFSPSGRRLVVLRDHDVQLLDGVTGNVAATFQLEVGAICETRFVDGERSFLQMCPHRFESEATFLWLDLERPRVVAAASGSAALSPNGRHLASLARPREPEADGERVTMWDLNARADPPRRIEVPFDPRLATGLDFDQDGRLRVLGRDWVTTYRYIPPPVKLLAVIDPRTGSILPRSSQTPLPSYHAHQWDAVAPRHRHLARRGLIPSYRFGYHAYATVALSADGSTLALVDGVLGDDKLAHDATVLVIDARRGTLLHRVPLPSYTPSTIQIQFGPGRHLAFSTGDAEGFIDARQGSLQLLEGAAIGATWSDDGRYAWNGFYEHTWMRDLESNRDVHVVTVDAAEAEAWRRAPDVRTAPAGLFCRNVSGELPLQACLPPRGPR